MMMDGVLSYATYRDLLKSMEPRDYAPANNPLLPPTHFMGMRVESTSAFPMQITCGTCNGTGEGEESTYCPKCKGQGANCYEGMMRNGPQTILLTVPLPKAFQPSFPRGLIAEPKLSRGLA